MKNALEIIYEDHAVLVCRKPAGTATQTRRLGQQDMETLLKNYRVQKKEPPYIGIVHRLDQPVEGLMVFAKTKEAAANLSAQVASHTIGKHYYAIVQNPQDAGIYGRLPGERGTLIDYLLFDKRQNRTIIVPEGEAGKGKKAVLDYQIIKQENELALLDITLHTGRQHQIRAQLAHRGCPILGDHKYGPEQPPETKRILPALCSYRLEFVHPSDGKAMDFLIQPEFLTSILYWNNIN